MSALDEKCPVCHAAVGEPCVNIITPSDPLPGREFHIGRTLSGYTAQEGLDHD